MNFEDGVGYIATKTIDSRQKAVVVFCGRENGELSFVKVGDVANAPVREFDGRETALVKFDDGEYFVSASVAVDPGEAKRVIDLILKR